MFQDITIEEWLTLQQKKELVLIDVRSPSEFEDATIPGSLNIPFFDDEERAEIGTLYTQVSVDAAKERGLAIASAKLPALVKEFDQIKQNKLVFCWRGGMRSKTTATVLSLMGIHVYRLTGGVRAYRKWVVDTLETMQFHPTTYVINGNTGMGKTAILHKLQDEGYPIIDLEAMAGHRGSIFGQIGLLPHNQKTFDSLLLGKLIEYSDAPFVLMEGESRRIGKVVMPEFLEIKKQQSVQIFIDLPLQERVRQIIEDYRPWEHKAEMLHSFLKIKDRIHTPIAKEIHDHLNEERYEQAVLLLLEHYYDPRYEYSAGQYEQERVDIKAQSVTEAAEKLKQFLASRK
ncbi:MAG: tRNA 2-selenouridine(34) synthase MnmH [Gorillibacterium sp.]|nr:tRNA 2-selenouridine(34) synthase MnmH [Gorillibacterium sp.]